MQITRYHKSGGVEWILISLKPYFGVRHLDLINNYDGFRRYFSNGDVNVINRKKDIESLNYFIEKMKRVCL